MNLEKIAAGINGIVTDAGNYIRHERSGFSMQRVSEKSMNQLVSDVDINAEKKLVEALHRLLPEAGFITEENTSTIGRAKLNWIIDPLDGTTNFIHDVPVYSVSVALAEDNKILAGSVYEIGRDELFTAYSGGGAWCNGKPIRVSPENTLKNSLIATGFPYYDFQQMNEYIEVLKTLLKQTHGLRRMGSAAVDMAYVACGRFEGFFEYGLNAWDIAAGVLLVNEAGGNVVDFKGGDDYLFGKTIIAGNNAIEKNLQEIIDTYF